MDFPTEIKINAEVKADITEAISIFVKGTSSGGSRILNAAIGKREADVLRHQMLTGAQTEKDLNEIRDGNKEYRDGVLVPIKQVAVLPAIIATEQREEQTNLVNNLLLAAKIAQELPPNDTVKSDQPLDPDWFARWRREAKVISEPILQGMWARILAEKAVNETEISYRTLDIIKNISVHDAMLFSKITPCISNGNNFICDVISLEKFPIDITIDELNKLAECNMFHVINENYMLNIVNEISYLQYNCYKIYIKKGSRLYSIPLTKSGQEIFSVVDKVPMSIEQAKSLCDYFIDMPRFNCSFVALRTATSGDSFESILYERTK